MSFPATPVNFPSVQPDPNDPRSLVDAIRALSRFRIGRAFLSEIVAVSASYSLRAGEDRVVLGTSGAGGITVTLPLAANADPVEYIIKKVDSGAGGLVVDPQTGETLDGASPAGAFTLSNQYDLVRVASDGTDWHITGRHP